MAEQTTTEPSLLATGEISEHQIDGKHIMLCNVAGEHYAISNICTHARVLLSKGKLRGHAITCPLHGARFDVRNGKCLSGPAFLDVETYPVSIEDDNVIIKVHD